MFVGYFTFFFFFGDTVTPNNIPFGILSGDLSFIVCKKVRYILTNRTTALCVYSFLSGLFIANWSIDNMNHDVPSYKMYPSKKNNGKKNKT